MTQTQFKSQTDMNKIDKNDSDTTRQTLWMV